MMNKQKTRYLLYGVFPLITALIGAVMVYLGYRYNSDAVAIDNVYTAVLFKNNFYTGAIVGFLLFAVVMALSVRVAHKKIIVDLTINDAPIIFSRAASGLFLVGIVVMQFLLDPNGTPHHLPADLAGTGTSSLLVAAKFQQVSLILALLAALYFLLPIFLGKLSDILRVVTGIAVLFWLTIQLIVNHYFMLEFLSSPNRIFTTLSLCALILFFLQEIPLFLPKRTLSKGYIAAGLTAFIISFSEAAPRLLLSLRAEAGMKVDLASFYTLLRLALGLYAFVMATHALAPELFGKRDYLDCVAPCILTELPSEPEEIDKIDEINESGTETFSAETEVPATTESTEPFEHPEEPQVSSEETTKTPTEQEQENDIQEEEKGE